MGIGWFCHCIRLFDHIMCAHETVCLVRQFSFRCYWIHYCWSQTPTKGKHRNRAFDYNSGFSLVFTHSYAFFSIYRNEDLRNKNKKRRQPVKPKQPDNRSKRPTTRRMILKKILKSHISKFSATMPLVVLFSVKQQQQQIDHFMNLQKVMDTNIHIHTYICTKSSATKAINTNKIHYNLLVYSCVDDRNILEYVVTNGYYRYVCVHVITYKCTDTMYISFSNNGKWFFRIIFRIQIFVLVCVFFFFSSAEVVAANKFCKIAWTTSERTRLYVYV